MRHLSKTHKLVVSAVLMSVGMVLPFLTGQLPWLGSRISPLHWPVLICGFICGGQYGIAVGMMLPLLRSMFFEMPPLMPTAAAMMVEMAVYGGVCGFLFQRLPKRNSSIYIALVSAMLSGRLAWGLINIPLYGVLGHSFSAELFLAGAFINAIPAIVIQLVLVPLLVIAIRKAQIR